MQDNFESDSEAAGKGTSGRSAAKWWPDFAEELAVYIHEIGVPDVENGLSQNKMIDEIFARMNERGKTEGSRTSVQPVVRAVMSRLCSAGN